MPQQPHRRRIRIAEGIYKDRYGLAATVKVGTVQKEIRFKFETPLRTIQKKRDELRVSLRKLPTDERGTLEADAERYLEDVREELTSQSCHSSSRPPRPR